MKKRPFLIFTGGVLLVAYVSAPFIAGGYRIGERSGPVFYPESFHEFLYSIAYESAHDEKPRQSIDSWMYRRPIMYGSPRRLKSDKERQAYIEMVRANESPVLERLIRMNEEVKSRPRPE